MTVGIIISTNDPDTCFLAIRYATFHLQENKEVLIYFVGPGLGFDKLRDKKYKLRDLLDIFEKSGGKSFKTRNHAILKKRLMRHFARLLHEKQIESICRNDTFQSIMTKEAYIKKFI